MGDTFRGIQSACSSRAVLFPVTISVPMERVFKGEEAEIQKLTGVRESSAQGVSRRLWGLWEKPGSLQREIRQYYTSRKLELPGGHKGNIIGLTLKGSLKMKTFDKDVPGMCLTTMFVCTCMFIYVAHTFDWYKGFIV